MKKITMILSLLFLAGLAGAQTLGNYKVKDEGRANNRIKKKDKRIYIADFQVNYQMGLFLQDEQEGGRMLGGGAKGDTKSTLVVGLAGVSEDDLQKLTNKLYEDYRAELESQGFEIVPPEEFYEQKAVQKKRDKRWKMRTYSEGPTAGDYFGSVVTKPQGLKTVVPTEEVDPSNPMNNMKTMYIAQTEMKVEQDADFIMNKVIVVVQAFENTQGAASQILSKMSNTATVKAETNFRVSGQWSKNNFNMYSIFSTSDIPIEGVLQKQKFNVQTSPDRDSFGADMGAFRVFTADNRAYEKIKTVTCDPKMYLKGAEMGAKAFLKETLQKLYENVK